MNPIKITLSYRAAPIGDAYYRIEKIVGGVLIEDGDTFFRVGDYINETQAKSVAGIQNVEITVIPTK